MLWVLLQTALMRLSAEVPTAYILLDLLNIPITPLFVFCYTLYDQLIKINKTNWLLHYKSERSELRFLETGPSRSKHQFTTCSHV